MRKNRRGTRKHRILLVERLDTRIALAADAIDGLVSSSSDFCDFADAFQEVGSSTGLNTAPTLSKPIQTHSSTDFSRSRIPLTVLGADDQGERSLTYHWRQLSGPGKVTFSTNDRNQAKKINATFNAAGDYLLQVVIRDSAGLETRTNYPVTILPKLTQLVVEQAGQTFRSGTKLTVSGTSTNFRLVAFDQFRNPMKLPAGSTWTYSSPRGANPVVSGSNNVNITFDRAGSYQFRTTVEGRTANVSFTVPQVLTSATIQPVDSVVPGKQVQLRVTGQDQFGQAMTRKPRFVWTTSAGTINSSGRFVAPSQAGLVTVTASSGTARATATISVQPLPNFGGFQDAKLATLIQRSFADGSITRPDMIAILRQAGVDGSVSTDELTDLRNLVRDANQYGIPDYVRSLAEDVVYSNPANATYQGRSLGNLAAGSTQTHLNQLVDKWFLGTDRPTLTSSSYVYRPARGTLFSGGVPHYLDQNQGALGDCYLVSALGMIAMTEPDAIRNMFIDNQDGTYTVRFYAGAYGAFYANDGSISDGFRSGSGVADYVTVDSWLPANSLGRFVYNNAGDILSSTSNALWLGLAEKAYAQWNATGNTGRSTVANAFAAIEGGWMSRMNAQVLGYNSNNYTLSNPNKQQLISALNSDRAVTFGTRASGQSGSLVGSHAYGIIGYDAGTDRFQLHNPWGSHHPAPMSYAELQATGTYFVVADASGFSTNVTTLSVRQVRGDEQAEDTLGMYYVDVLANVPPSEMMFADHELPTADNHPSDEPLAATSNWDTTGETWLEDNWQPRDIEDATQPTAADAADRVFTSLDLLDELFAELESV